METRDELLAEVGDLLGRYGYEERSPYVRNLLRDGSSPRVWEELSGLEFWGGSGAIWEVEPFQYSHPGNQSSFVDYRRFQALMIELADLLDARGLGGMAERNASMFRRELAGDCHGEEA